MELSKPERIGQVSMDYRWYDGVDQYNDGDEVEELVLSICKEGKNVYPILQNDSRWPVLYQLSPGREVIIEPMNLMLTDHVLEIGAGMGAVTGAIARRVCHVDCVELSLRRAMANAWRHQEYENIRILVGNYHNMHLETRYNVVTLIGVLEYAGYYMHGVDNAPLKLLERVKSQMQIGGRLYIAIENRLGMKYFSGCCEDHLAYSFPGVEGYPARNGIQTFSKSELEELLIDAGFGDLYFYYPFPDYKFPSVIYAEDNISKDLTEFIPDVLNMDLHRIRTFDERRAQLSLTGTREFGVFANSFLVEAVRL